MKEIFEKVIKGLKGENFTATEPTKETFSELQDFALVLSVEDYFCHEREEFDTKLLICLPPDFPEKLPKVYLKKDFFNRIKWIPHLDVDSKGRPHICVFDENYSTIRFEKEVEAIEEAIQRARTTIHRGVKMENWEDFNREFQSYWENQYELEPEVSKGYLFFGNIEGNKIIYLDVIRILDSCIGFHTCILSSDRYHDFLTQFPPNNVKVEKKSALFIWIFDIAPA